MTPDQLLQPRIIVQNNYPRSPYKHYEIIENPSIEQMDWAKVFTLNLRVLHWYEHRELEEMPLYAKQVYTGQVAKVNWVKKSGYYFAMGIEYPWNSELYVLPATEQEYNEYNQSKK